MQEMLHRRRAFLTAMAELLRRRRAIQAGLQVHLRPPVGMRQERAACDYCA